MFRWCAYCQRLLGETAPFDDYVVSHGICEACAEHVLQGKSSPVKGLQLFKQLFAAARAGNPGTAERLAEEALAQGWRPSDVAVGLLQPALYEIGRLWAADMVTVAEEHIFTSWCERALTLLESRAPIVAGPARLLICMVEGNCHSVGPRIAALHARDLGSPARAVVGALPDEEILDLCRREAPEVLGLSVSMSSHLTRARAVIERLGELPHPPRVILGGLAARMPEAEGFERTFTASDLGKSLESV